MKQPHSPGPWSVEQTGPQSFVIRSTAGIVVARIDGPRTPGHDRETADAALIQAAPLLLEALRDITGVIATIRDEQVSAGMGFGNTEAEKRQRATIYAAEIQRQAARIEDAVTKADAALAAATVEAPEAG